MGSVSHLNGWREQHRTALRSGGTAPRRSADDALAEARLRARRNHPSMSGRRLRAVTGGDR